MIKIFLYFAGVLSLINCFLQLLGHIIAMKKIKSVDNIKIKGLIKYPLISVIITAKDEEDEIGAAIKSRLKTDYPNIEFIIINDRSKDRTPEIINELAKEDKRVHAIHIKELPEGWLGKLNALNEGKKIAKGEWLLFSDGDVFIKPGTLKKVMGRCLDEKIKFLAIVPDFYRSSFFVDIIITVFFRALATVGRIQEIENSRSSASIGSGSFNFVRKEEFEKAGGFEKLKMEVIDDVTMGQILKSSGFKISVLFSKGFVGVKWYSNLRSLYDGMGRAFMAAVGNYNIIQLYIFSTIAFILDIIPFVFLFPLNIPYLQIIGLISVILIIPATVISDRSLGRPFYYSFFLPISYILIYSIALSGGLKIFINGGLKWRDTFYSTRDLKRGRVFKYFPKIYK